MQTYSHYIITAVVRRILRKKAITMIPPLNGKAFLVGSILPDLPLTLIAAVTIIVDGISRTDTRLTQWLFDTAFFQVTWVKIAHNLFHGPIPILIYMCFGFITWKAILRHRRWSAAVFWVACGCLLHSLIDIPLHYNDGPLILFPFDFETRFYSPVSYWDPNHYGRIAAALEHVIVLVLLIWLIFDWRRSKRAC